MQLKMQAEPWSHSFVINIPLPHLEHLYIMLKEFKMPTDDNSDSKNFVITWMLLSTNF